MSTTPREAADAERHLSSTRGVLLLWFGLLAPPAAFLSNLQVTYTVVTLNCSGARPWLHLSAVLWLALAAGAGLVAWSTLKRAGEQWPTEEAGTLERSRFLAVLGLLSAALFGALILAQWLPAFFLDPCSTL